MKRLCFILFLSVSISGAAQENVLSYEELMRKDTALQGEITVLASKKTRCFLLLNELQKYNNFNKLHVFRFFLFLCRTHYPTVEYYADGWRGLKAPFFFTPLRGGTHYPLASYCPADGCSRNCFCILWAIADPIGEGSIRGCSRPRILRPPSPPLPKS